MTQPFGKCPVEKGPQGRTLIKREKLQGDRFWFNVRKKCLTIRTVPEQNKLSLWLLVGDDSNDDDDDDGIDDDDSVMIIFIYLIISFSLVSSPSAFQHHFPI